MRGKEQDNRSLNQLVLDTGLDEIRMAEIGSYAGESAELFANNDKVSSIWCIDPWKAGYDSSDVASSSDFVEVEKAFNSVMERHPTKIRKFRGTIDDFRKEYSDIDLDFIYIDGCHTYEACKRDLETALQWKSLKAIGGHDYVQGWSGVMKAVDEVVGNPDFTYQDESWLKILKHLQNKENVVK